MKLLNKYKKVSRIGLTPPQPREGRSGLALVAIIKDEADYLPEWIAYHKAIGVSGFHLYDNGSSDDTAAVAAQAIGDAGGILPFSNAFLDTRLNRPIDMQVLAFAHGIANFGAAYRWMAFIDPDEFLVPIASDDIHQPLAALEGEVNISLPWHMFGPGGHDVPPKGLTIDNYTTRYQDGLFPQSRYPLKLLLDPCQVTMISPHQASTERDGAFSANTRGERFENKARHSERFYAREHIQLNHYFTRSLQELKERKMKRGRLDAQGGYVDKDVQEALDLIEAHKVTDESATRFSQKTKDKMRELGFET